MSGLLEDVMILLPSSAIKYIIFMKMTQKQSIFSQGLL